MAFVAKGMDLEITMQGEVRQWETNIIWYHLYVESKKRMQINLFAEQKQTQTLKTYSYQRGQGGGQGEADWEFEMEMF